MIIGDQKKYISITRNVILNMKSVSKKDFIEVLLRIMEHKFHDVVDVAVTQNIRTSQLAVHLFYDLFAVVRLFPELMKKIYLADPDLPPEVLKDLEENIEEELTGKHFAGESHEKLFLEIFEDLKIPYEGVSESYLGEAGQKYVSYMRMMCQLFGWAVGLALTIIFMEGGRYDRSVLDSTASKRPKKNLSSTHAFIRFHNGTRKSLKFSEVHNVAEEKHRVDAWKNIKLVPKHMRTTVLLAVVNALDLFLEMREEEIGLMGL